MDDLRKNRLKHITGIIVPLLVVIITVVVVGSSFAWYSDSATAEIATINLSTAEAYTLEFNVVNATILTTDKYHGQTAYETDSTSENYGKYITNSDNSDVCYLFMARVRINSGTSPISLKVYFSALEIGFYTGEGTDRTLNTNLPYISIPSTDTTTTPATNHIVSDINYGFTWYFYNTAYTNAWYTPYGIGSLKGANTPNYTQNNAETDPPFADWNSGTPVLQNIPQFTSDGTETFNFVIVFCPEKLFWMQKSTYDADGSGSASVPNNTMTFSQVYGTANQYYASGSNAEYAKSYTNNEYQGADFKFTVTFERA